MSDIGNCKGCGQELATVPVNEASVAEDGCQNCSPGIVNVFYVPIPSRSGEEIGSTNEQSSGRNSTTKDAEKLTQNSVKKIDCKDEIQLTKSDGSSRNLFVTKHDKRQEIIYTRDLNDRANNEIELWTYPEIFQANGHVLFEFPEQREDWDCRPDIPCDFPRSDSKNEKNFLELLKRKYIKTIYFIKSSMEVVSQKLTRAVGMAAATLAKGLVIPAKVVASPFITMFYLAWGHDALKEKLASGIITENEYEEQSEWYRSYCAKAAVVTGCAVGGIVAMGITWYLSNRIVPILLEELKKEWIAKTPDYTKICTYTKKTFLYFQAQTPVEALQILAKTYPRLGQLVAFVGGPEMFLAIGAIALVVGGGLLGWYLHKKFTNKKALADLADHIKVEADKKTK